MTPDAAIGAFACLRAVEADDAKPPQSSPAPSCGCMPALLVDVAERIVVPVIALPGRMRASRGRLRSGGPRTVFITTLRGWGQGGPDAAEGIARAVVTFTTQILAEDHEDVADVLK